MGGKKSSGKQVASRRAKYKSHKDSDEEHQERSYRRGHRGQDGGGLPRVTLNHRGNLVLKYFARIIFSNYIKIYFEIKASCSNILDPVYFMSI